MNEQKQIYYGILGSCIGVALGFAIGFPIFFTLTWEQRSYIGLPLMMFLTLALAIVGGAVGIKLGKRGEEDDEED